MQRSQRPLSPHLQIYSPQWTSVLSILHRGSGIVISVGALLLALWLWAVADSPDSYALAQTFFTSLTGKALLLIWTLCTFYHLCNGVRHLVWDAGMGLSLVHARRSGKIVVFASVALTALVWYITP